MLIGPTRERTSEAVGRMLQPIKNFLFMSSRMMMKKKEKKI
jgi:hypothetical protein